MKYLKGSLGGISVILVLALSLLCAHWEKASTNDGILVHVVDVGQADCIVIETPDGNVMIDTGTDISETSLRAYLRSNGLTEFDYLILSHPHDDHIGNADMMLTEFSIHQVVCAESNSEEAVWQNFLSVIDQKSRTGETEWVKPVIGAVYWVGALRMEVLLAPDAENDGENNDSLIVRAEFGDCSMLFTGDAEAEEEDHLLASVPAERLQVDWLKVGHHGSSSSTTQDFLQVIRPRIAVISAGSGNSFSHPHEELLQRLRTADAEIYRTDLDGTLRFYCDGERFSLLS